MRIAPDHAGLTLQHRGPTALLQVPNSTVQLDAHHSKVAGPVVLQRFLGAQGLACAGCLTTAALNFSAGCSAVQQQHARLSGVGLMTSCPFRLTPAYGPMLGPMQH